MPTQSRDAQWSCDYCGLQGLYSFEQTKAHELDCRKRQRPGHPGPEARALPPFTMPPAPSETYAYPPQPAARAHAHAEHNPHLPVQTSPSKMRRVRLMGPAEGQHLDMADSVACQNVELFEASQQQVAKSEPANPAEGSISLGQVGIRCIHCLPGNAYSTLYPEHTDNLATFIQMLSDRHLSVCTVAPLQVRQLCEQKAARRQQDHEQRRQPTHDEERQQHAFFDHCRFLAGSVGLVDRYPPKVGVGFRDGVYGQQMEAQGERYSNEQPPSMRGPMPTGAPFQAPPPRAGPGHQMMEGVAATPIARRTKHSGQERDYPPPSIERREFMGQGGGVDRREYPPSGGEREGYPAFQPHIPGSYPPDGPQDRTPGGPRRPMDHSDPTQQQTPQGPRVESPYAQSPYGMPPPEFPYFQEMNGTWACRYCSHVHPQYRDQGSTWASAASPPPGQFIDQHLTICRSYNQGPPPPYYDAPPAHMSPYNYGPPAGQFGGQYAPPGWGPAGPGGQFVPADAPYSYHPPPSDQAPMYAPPPAMDRDPPPSRPSRSTARATPPNVSEVPDHESLKAIDILVTADKQHFGTTFVERESRGQLVLDEDKLLLTEYFYHLMRQLRLCRFAEADRKTRGGKRESIKVGYGGLQCVHCTDAPNSRKFFWSNVDRLANSFAEIPGHVLKCRRCPVPVKNALIALKKRHPEQMARLPRGSQKVFFRRMWRRLHYDDPGGPGDLLKKGMAAAAGKVAGKSNDENIAPSNSPAKPTVKTGVGPGESPDHSSDESCFLIERTTTEAAKALAQSSSQPTGPASPSSRIMLALAEDKEWLSDMDCFIRRNLEVFCANEEDVEIAQQDRKYPIHIGQVGIRCIHCAMKNGTAARGTAVAYPYSINGIYESVREFQRLHLESCAQLPDATRTKLAGFKGSSSLSSVLRRYYVLAAKALGMHDTSDGIRSGGDCVPLGSSTASAFSFNDWRQNKDLPPNQRSGEAGFLQTAVTPLESRKRKTSLSEEKSPSSGSSKKSRGK